MHGGNGGCDLSALRLGEMSGTNLASSSITFPGGSSVCFLLELGLAFLA